MKKFLIKIIVFSIPIFILFCIPAIFLKIAGENYTSIDKIIKSEYKYLIGYAYDESNYQYLKSKVLKTHRVPSILALGSSRILSFREKMFTESFYNAGYTISSISDFVPFIENNLNSEYPDVLLIALDQWMFNEKWDQLSNNVENRKVWQKSFKKNASVKTIYAVWSDLIKGKYSFNMLKLNNNYDGVKKVGLNAIVNNKGFRNDGSIHYGDQITKLLQNDDTAIDYNYNDTFSRINEGNKKFEYGTEINIKALNVLNDFLAFCKRNNIYVVGIMPPFADKVNNKMYENKNYNYMDNIFVKSNDIFNDNGFELWDMTYLGKYKSGDKETIDGFHGGEVTYLRMLIFMIENGSRLKDFTDLENLKNNLNNRLNDYMVYEN